MIPLVSFNMHCKPNYNNYQNLYHMYHSDFIAVSIFINYIYNKYYNSFSKTIHQLPCQTCTAQISLVSLAARLQNEFSSARTPGLDRL